MEEPTKGLMTIEELNEYYLSLTGKERTEFEEKLAQLYDSFGIEDDMKIEGLEF
jgi:hypothetical protein